MIAPNKSETCAARHRPTTLAVAAALLGSVGIADASVALYSYSENTTSFQAVYSFTPDITPLDGQSTGLGSWTANLTQSYTPAVPSVSPASYVFSWEGAHVATPHAGELPLLLANLGTCSIDAASLTGTFCDTTTDVPHLDLDNLLYQHYDQYHFWLELVSGGGYAYLTGTHVGEVPVPAAAWLLGSGLFGVAVAGHRKKTAAHG